MNETPIMFSGLKMQGEINRMEEVFGGSERIYRGVPSERRYYEVPDIFAEYEAERPGRAGPKREQVLEPDTTTG